MAAWSDGYFTDVPYTTHFFDHLAPAAMAFACLRQGVRPPDLGPGSTYLELGCGQGYSLNLLAAANPEIRFWGVDFNPVHIANAQRLARAAGLTNITFDDLSFEQMLEVGEDRIPECDVVALHGVYSWVSPANRALIVRILDRHVKPGGLVSISYNVFPAWSKLMPLRHFVKGHFDRGSGDPLVRARDAFCAAQDLIDNGARGFSDAALAALVKNALASEPAYLIHEYMNDHFHPFYHADVVRELEPARLTFAASANAAEELPILAAPKRLQPQIAGEADPLWRETLLDYANGRLFRRDIFVRGRSPLTPAERRSLLNAVRFNLLVPPAEVSFDFKIPLGTLTGDPETYGAVVGALADGPRSYEELAALGPLKAEADRELVKILGLLIEAGAVHPADHGGEAAGAAKAFNRTLLHRFTREDRPSHLASPVAGTGVQTSFIDLLALSAAVEAKPDFAAAARRGWNLLAVTGSSLTIEGKTLSGPEEHEAGLIRSFESFKKTKLPTYRRLGVI